MIHLPRLAQAVLTTPLPLSSQNGWIWSPQSVGGGSPHTGSHNTWNHRNPMPCHLSECRPSIGECRIQACSHRSCCLMSSLDAKLCTLLIARLMLLYTGHPSRSFSPSRGISLHSMVRISCIIRNGPLQVHVWLSRTGAYWYGLGEWPLAESIKSRCFTLREHGVDAYISIFMIRQYGDLFTFILMGRKMTVALGPKGNNLILGGRLNQVSAEEAYTVSHFNSCFHHDK